MMETQTLMLLGLVANIAATVGGYVGMLLRFEHRLTKLETHIIHLLPKRKEDRGAVSE